MSIDTVMSKVQQEIPECLAVGLVDMSTGMLLGVRTIDSHPQEVLDLVAAASADLFQGKSVTTIEQMFRRARGQPDDGHHYFKEIIVFSDNLLHLFMRSKKSPSIAACFVTRATANVGMALSRSRLAMGEFDKVL